ncbi:hypothetical protein M3Y99_01478600 [Aphelenchoides fujianensis]|nr:hypothetical protein M3Y99_01478600 [Aphelenchoides fujianensis]
MFERMRRPNRRDGGRPAEEARREPNGRLPVYRQAIIRVCQLQLKICTKLLEIAPSKPLRRQPKSLKQIAGVTVLQPFRSLDASPQRRRLAVERLRGLLPNDLVLFLHGQ